MIAKEYGKFVPTCDSCDEQLTPCDTFDEAVDKMKEEGWKCGKFSDLCPDCKEGF